MVYKFTGKGLFIFAGIFCLFTIIFIPLGLFFFYAAKTAHIKIANGTFTYKMFGTKNIPFAEIRKIEILKHVEVRYKVGYTIPTFATVVPMQITYGDNKKVKFSLNYFEKPEEIAEELQKGTGKKIEVPE